MKKLWNNRIFRTFLQTTISTIVTFFTINNIINIYGIGISKSGTCFPLPYVYNNLNAQIELVYLASSQQIRITTGQDRSGVNGYVTIEYTKTTD